MRGCDLVRLRMAIASSDDLVRARSMVSRGNFNALAQPRFDAAVEIARKIDSIGFGRRVLYAFAHELEYELQAALISPSACTERSGS